LEVLPAYQNRGIGSKLVSMMLAQLKHLYMIDLICDQNLQSYDERFGMKKAQGMMIRHYSNQSGIIKGARKTMLLIVNRLKRQVWRFF